MKNSKNSGSVWGIIIPLLFVALIAWAVVNKIVEVSQPIHKVEKFGDFCEKKSIWEGEIKISDTVIVSFDLLTPSPWSTDEDDTVKVFFSGNNKTVYFFHRSPANDYRIPNPSFDPNYKGKGKNGEKFMENWRVNASGPTSKELFKDACSAISQARKILREKN